MEAYRLCKKSPISRLISSVVDAPKPKPQPKPQPKPKPKPKPTLKPDPNPQPLPIPNPAPRPNSNAPAPKPPKSPANRPVRVSYSWDTPARWWWIGGAAIVVIIVLILLYKWCMRGRKGQSNHRDRVENVPVPPVIFDGSSQAITDYPLIPSPQTSYPMMMTTPQASYPMMTMNPLPAYPPFDPTVSQNATTIYPQQPPAYSEIYHNNQGDAAPSTLSAVDFTAPATPSGVDFTVLSDRK